MSNKRRGYREVLEEFINIYRSEPCLWQMKNKEYHNRKKKTIAYNKLINQLKEIEPSANREMVVKKINGLRTTYRKEKKKKEAYLKFGDTQYEPTLWYYDLMSFLDGDQETPVDTPVGRDSCSNTEEIEEYESTEEITSESMERDSIGSERHDTLETKSMSDMTPIRSRRDKRKCPTKTIAWTNEMVPTTRYKRSSIEEDRFDAFGKNIAMKLRDLPKQQRLIAEKIINDTLFQAEMGLLTLPKTE
ncbi:unnamed protein product [Euphydryas editha]|uniref:MADF domain-containing protein n=1 Tax=Euphydryas editha TaxID=104508 RepID=A0AAU9UFE5_EUPED|nr:unnamed protein product [Euphydryas editha]